MRRMTIATALGQAAWTARRHWRALPPDRRTRLQALLRQSARQPASLSEAERQELRMLVGELNLGEVARQTATRASSRGTVRRRW
jgi:hypothetical protein